jgi:hypothetical protein
VIFNGDLRFNWDLMGFNGDLMDVMEEIAMVNVGKTMPYG